MGGTVLTQARWRTVGAITIGGAALMAIYAVATDVLRDTILHALNLFGVEPTNSGALPNTAAWLVTVYWTLFFVLIAMALYCALLDLRYIRMRYAMEKREIFRRTVGDKEFREALLQRDSEKK